MATAVWDEFTGPKRIKDQSSVLTLHSVLGRMLNDSTRSTSNPRLRTQQAQIKRNSLRQINQTAISPSLTTTTLASAEKTGPQGRGQQTTAGEISQEKIDKRTTAKSLNTTVSAAISENTTLMTNRTVSQQVNLPKDEPDTPLTKIATNCSEMQLKTEPVTDIRPTRPLTGRLRNGQSADTQQNVIEQLIKRGSSIGNGKLMPNFDPKANPRSASQPRRRPTQENSEISTPFKRSATPQKLNTCESTQRKKVNRTFDATLRDNLPNSEENEKSYSAEQATLDSIGDETTNNTSGVFKKSKNSNVIPNWKENMSFYLRNNNSSIFRRDQCSQTPDNLNMMNPSSFTMNSHRRISVDKKRDQSASNLIAEKEKNNRVDSVASESELKRQESSGKKVIYEKNGYKVYQIQKKMPKTPDPKEQAERKVPVYTINYGILTKINPPKIKRGLSVENGLQSSSNKKLMIPSNSMIHRQDSSQKELKSRPCTSQTPTVPDPYFQYQKAKEQYEESKYYAQSSKSQYRKRPRIVVNSLMMQAEYEARYTKDNFKG